MFRNLCTVFRNPKNPVCFTNRIRFVTTYNATKMQRGSNREPGELIKWILLMCPVTSFGLGCWQVSRLQWKLDLISRLEAKSNSKPIDFPADYAALQNMEYKPVRVKGEFIHEKEFLIGPRALIETDPFLSRSGSLVSDPKKNQGWLVITPFKLTDTGETIFVNRGWVPQKMSSKDKRESSMVKGELELIGVVRLTEKRPPFMPKNRPEKGSWFYRDLEQMSDFFGCTPVWLDVRGMSEPPDGWPIPNQTRVTLRNEHVSYVVTWFSLSGFTGFMWYRYFIRKLPLL